MRIAIMTDSNTGMSNAEAKELGVYLLPMPVIIDGNVYFEGQNLTTEEFFSSLEEGKDVTTSQPSPGDVMDMFVTVEAFNGTLLKTHGEVRVGESLACSADLGLFLVDKEAMKINK